MMDALVRAQYESQSGKGRAVVVESNQKACCKKGITRATNNKRPRPVVLIRSRTSQDTAGSFFVLDNQTCGDVTLFTALRAANANRPWQIGPRVQKEMRGECYYQGAPTKRVKKENGARERPKREREQTRTRFGTTYARGACQSLVMSLSRLTLAKTEKPRPEVHEMGGCLLSTTSKHNPLPSTHERMARIIEQR